MTTPAKGIAMPNITNMILGYWIATFFTSTLSMNLASVNWMDGYVYMWWILGSFIMVVVLSALRELLKAWK